MAADLRGRPTRTIRADRTFHYNYSPDQNGSAPRRPLRPITRDTLTATLVERQTMRVQIQIPGLILAGLLAVGVA